MNKKMLVIPMAGLGQRFVDAGYVLPKQLLPLGDRTCLHESLNSFNTDIFDKIVIIGREDYFESYDINEILMEFGGEAKIDIISLKHKTQGSVQTVLDGLKGFDDSWHLTIYTLDVSFTPYLDLKEKIFQESPNNIFTVKTNNPGFSYVDVDESGQVKMTAEKYVISQYGATGLYMFESVGIFKKYGSKMMSENNRMNNEFYICPLYNYLIEDNINVNQTEVPGLLMFGTPKEYNFIRKYCYPTNKKIIGIASDHSGYIHKKNFSKILKANGFNVIDYGCYSEKACDYPDYVKTLASDIVDQHVTYGFSFCDTGQGVNMAASSIEGIRSVLVWDLNLVKLNIEHNAPNHFSIPARLYNDEFANSLISGLINTTFSGCRHQDRIMKL